MRSSSKALQKIYQAVFKSLLAPFGTELADAAAVIKTRIYLLVTTIRFHPTTVPQPGINMVSLWSGMLPGVTKNPNCN
jgi:hypothetical protein